MRVEDGKGGGVCVCKCFAVIGFLGSCEQTDENE